MEITFEYIVLTLALVISGLWLEKYEPPIKRQWIATILLIVGSISAHSYIDNGIYGFLIAGLVYYKQDLVAEVKEVLQSYKDIKET
ncbi:hypothetical protein [Clostridium chrysemydis]|uniref:hypothetical protein n=1 Tax=Clostridium chrysemydis TaxID=2665504 RepID=UPI0018834583|nr:hypothetical protein [Clostridium chrysemydis]